MDGRIVGWSEISDCNYSKSTCGANKEVFEKFICTIFSWPPLFLAWEKPKLCLLVLKLCLGWKFLSVWDWKQIRLQFDCCYRPIKLTVNSSLSDVLSNSRREKFFSKKRVLYFPAFAFVILWRDVDICKNAKSTTPAVKIKGYSFNPVASLFPLEVILIMAICGNLSTVWQKSTCRQI